METPQAFDHDPRVPRGPQKRVTTLHHDPDPGPNPNPGGGRRNIVKLAMKERIRRREAMKSQGTFQDPAVIQAKALVDAAGTVTQQEEVQLRLERQQQRHRAQQEIARQRLSQGHDAAEANARMRRRAAAERTLEQKGLPVNAENLALLLGEDLEQMSRPATLPSNLRGTARPGQNVAPVTPIDTGVLDESQDPNYGGVPMAPVGDAPVPEATDETQVLPSVAESLQSAIAAELEQERLAFIEDKTKKATEPTELDAQVARAYLEALGFEVVPKVSDEDFSLTDEEVEGLKEALEPDFGQEIVNEAVEEVFLSDEETYPGESGTEGVEPS